MPALKVRPCWTRYLEFDASIEGANWFLLAMAMCSYLDVKRNPKLLADLEMRCRSALAGLKEGNLGIMPDRTVPPFRYTDEPMDTWSAYSVLAERFPDQTIAADCDCLGPAWCAFWKTRTGRGAPRRVGVGVTQPKTRPCCNGKHCDTKKMCGHGMAHLYDVIQMPAGFVPASDLMGSLVKSDSLEDWLETNGEDSQDVYVWDGSVAGGMNRPKGNFYGSGETSILWMPGA